MATYRGNRAGQSTAKYTAPSTAMSSSTKSGLTAQQQSQQQKVTNPASKGTMQAMRLRDLEADIRQDVVRNRLIYTIGKGEADKLERAIDDFKKIDADDPKALLTKAEIILQYLVLRDELFTHIDNADLDNLLDVCLRVEAPEMRLYKELLTAELMQARKAITVLKRKAMIPTTLTFDDRTMRELRRYNQPPKVMRDVIIATFLLLGECEDYTADWSQARELLNPFGKSTGFLPGNRRIKDRLEDFDAMVVHPEIGARARELLQSYSISDAYEVSECCASFYVWCKAALDSAEQQIGNTRPASIARQHELLSILPTARTPRTSRPPTKSNSTVTSIPRSIPRSKEPTPSIGGLSADELPVPNQPRPLPAPYRMPAGSKNLRR